jgi:outer membrane protein OmpA-like peptidoglycan-associated protein
MKRQWLVWILAALPMLATNSTAKKSAAKDADGAKETDKPMAAAGQLNSTKPGSSVPGSELPGEATPDAGKLEATINAALLEASRQFQCIFKGDTDILAPGCDFKAQRLADAIKDARSQLLAAHVASFKFEVSGHMDTRGNPTANKALSEKRAAAIVKQLVAKGISARELLAVGMGSEQPLVKPDNTPAKQAVNRRYELRVHW